MKKIFNGMYLGKRVMITGHTGFKGSWLTLWLKELGAEVLGYSLEPNTSPSMFQICKSEECITSIIGDIRDEDNLTNAMIDFKPDIVFHLAAQPLVRLSYIEPKITYETNVMGTLNVYEAVRKCSSVKAVVTITTDKCYENKEWVYGYRETDPLGGYDPYSSSKGCSEILTTSYRNSYFNSLGVRTASTRAGNVIGGGDWAQDRLIPDLVRSICNDSPLIVRNPIATRPWQHVLEPLSGYLLLGALLLQDDANYDSAWNFGPLDSDILTVEEVLKLSIEKWGKGSYKIEKLTNLHEANLLKLDISKAMAELKWKPIYSVKTAINKTIEWYKYYYDNENANMQLFSINQIKEYVNEAKKKQVLWSVE
ncbi:CDP-glucose 4%2C6-dehydratase [uncultured Clostridium sp.]|nr:CDP-glucose 4%2C6-dehydratase [uncultured Clostridium sp.]